MNDSNKYEASAKREMTSTEVIVDIWSKYDVPFNADLAQDLAEKFDLMKEAARIERSRSEREAARAERYYQICIQIGLAVGPKVFLGDDGHLIFGGGMNILALPRLVAELKQK